MDTTIAILPSRDPDRRLRVSLQSGKGPGGLQLIDESFSSDVGWYAQSSVHVAPEQVAALRTLLGTHVGSEKQKTDGQLAAASDKPVLSIVRAG